MASIIGSQAQTYHDSIIAAHREAMKVADLEDAMAIGVGMVNGVCHSIGGRHARGIVTAEDADGTTRRAVELLLTAMPVVVEAARALVADGHPFDAGTIEEYEDAMLSAREALACLIDPTQWSAVRVPTLAELEVGAKDPPQSWYDEDTSGLNGDR